ncbi:MAG TPA: 3-hydroxyacyl-CoA dehydrogenase NAD-binding domain-containing protein [Gemmataceae bacterium]|jgi:3-hydroxyacyl-CoA dehydrogenase/enoyl-CoA hydratase/3-hydroxybutyryl-CoA epimerase/3-hydroxyacyl-CoA dehydrogenase/enoyl-CoA hydratase/3-hydroxybutyryl-CoA epimerase/enoyl-CoA isomerase|nr:3-hydroxyacyl-CoA dehydrogenase NAD-binding domain-containing protein [Gemmataceae bacterium]
MPPTYALKLDIHDKRIAVITFDMPGSRANTLGQAVLGEFEAIVAQLAKRNDLQGLILQSGKPGMFIAGADLKELGAADPEHPEVSRKLILRGLAMIASIEALPFPTVALIDGPCMGGGTEVALGFDQRIAGTNPKTEIGLPEVKVGLIPGWGGTQRLPRLVGPSLAMEIILPGESVKAKRAQEIGLVYDVVPSDKLFAEGIRLLEDLNANGEWKEIREKKKQPVGLSEEQGQFMFGVARAMIMDKTKGQLPAPLKALEAVEKGCNRTLDEGLKIETDLVVPLAGSPISKNLIAVFFMNQRLQKDTGIADASIQPKQASRVGILGAGIMGAGIAAAHARKGIPVALLDSVPQALQKGIGGIAAGFQKLAEKGRMKPDDVTAAMTRVAAGAKLSDVADCDVVIEAIVENEKAKTALYKELEPLLKPDAILASNTSTISITRMAKSLSKPERFCGMHFFNPVERMPLVEIIRGEKTNDQTVVTLVALAKQVGKTPIVVKDGPGFLVNRVLFPYLDEALQLLLVGAEPRELDKAALAFGMPMGPITLYDVVGLDTSVFAGRVMHAAFPERVHESKLLEDLVAAGRLGQKSGAGFYRYAKGLKGEDDPAVAPILAKHRKETRKIAPEEITERLFLPMLTEATRVLEEGLVRDPTDVDMGLILGIGFPPQRGGILRWGDSVGAANILKTLAKYEKLGGCFKPTESIKKLAASGKRMFP